MTALVLKELDRLAVTYRKGEKNTHVSSHSIKNNQN
jgi:hypothetical protein